MAEAAYFIRVQMYGGIVSRHQTKMADQFPNFSLGFCFDSEFFCDLENENENELLASVDLESPFSNFTNYTPTESKISEQLTDVNIEPASSIKTSKERFVNRSSAEIDQIITKAETKNTKENTKWAIRVFEGEFYSTKYMSYQQKHATRIAAFCKEPLTIFKQFLC